MGNVPSSGSRVLTFILVTLGIGFMCLVSQWFWLDAVWGFIYVVFLLFWGISTQPVEDYSIGIDERKN